MQLRISERPSFPVGKLFTLAESSVVELVANFGKALLAGLIENFGEKSLHFQQVRNVSVEL